MLIDEDEEGDSGFRASDFEFEFGPGVGASGGPQRSGLATGDVFSPRVFRGGRGSISFALGDGQDGDESFDEGRRNRSSGVRATWLLSPEDE